MDIYVLEIQRRMCIKTIVNKSRPTQLGLHFADNTSIAFSWIKIILFEVELHGYLFTCV